MRKGTLLASMGLLVLIAAGCENPEPAASPSPAANGGTATSVADPATAPNVPENIRNQATGNQSGPPR